MSLGSLIESDFLKTLRTETVSYPFVSGALF